jgi:hypothetical protein
MQLKIISASPLYPASRAGGYNEKPQAILTFAGSNGLGRGWHFLQPLYELSSALAQRAFAARWAIAVLSSCDNFAALARPPFRPPNLPSATAAGFFFFGLEGNCIGFFGSTNGSPIASSTTRRAFWATSLLERTCIHYNYTRWVPNLAPKMF